jgi:hypothetical protein
MLVDGRVDAQPAGDVASEPRHLNPASVADTPWAFRDALSYML